MQHAIMDELEWRRGHARLNEMERDQGVSDLIDLVAAVDGIVQMQAQADAGYFVLRCGRTYSSAEETAIHDVLRRRATGRRKGRPVRFGYFGPNLDATQATGATSCRNACRGP